jgi:hypothetical protein
VGQSSPFIPTANGGFILYVKGQLPLDPGNVQRDLPEFLARMRQQLQVAAFQAWFGRQVQLHLVTPPGDTSASGG